MSKPIKDHAAIKIEKDKELFQDFLNALSKAYDAGHSLVQLARLLNHQDCAKLYAYMADAGMFPRISHKRHTMYDLPPEILGALKECNISFSQWCCSHGFDPKLTAELISKDVLKGEKSSETVHLSLKNDFPFLYGGHSGSSTLDHLLPELQTPRGLTIEFDPFSDKYIAHIHEIPECRVETYSLDRTYDLIQIRYVLIISIKKLRAAASVQNEG